jgi:hypothetical protein
MTKTREAWRHEWPISGGEILLGTQVCCAGCGRDRGTTTVAFSDEALAWMKDRPTPEWPFDEETCPLCQLQDQRSAALGEAFELRERVARHLKDPSRLR